MSELELGGVVALVTVGLLLLGTPVAFVLGGVAIIFLVAYEGVAALDIVPTECLLWRARQLCAFVHSDVHRNGWCGRLVARWLRSL